MAEYSCNSAECDGRIFDSREGTSRCIHCGSEDIGRLDKPWRRPLILIVLFVLIGGGLGWYGLYLDDTDRENLHSVFGTGCKDLTACNYLQAPIFEDKDLCEYKKDFRDCQGLCINDMDGDDVCDEQEIEGCIDSIACNFDKLATEPREICEYPEPGFTCAGDCVNDKDGDGICDENEVLGCTDPEACNFDASATESDGSCWYREAGKSCNDAMQSNTNSSDLGVSARCESFMYQGSSYEVIEINNRCWFASNLKTRMNSDGELIDIHNHRVADNKTGEYHATSTGIVYNYYAIASQDLCPSGWRIPTRFDWYNLLRDHDALELIVWQYGGTNSSGLGISAFDVKAFDGSLRREMRFWIPTSTKSLSIAESMFFSYTVSDHFAVEEVFKSSFYGVRCIKNI